MSLREQENQEALEKHLMECVEAAKEHLAELERTRIRDEEYKIPKDLGFWERKKRQTQALRNKVLAATAAEDVPNQTRLVSASPWARRGKRQTIWQH